MKNKIKYLHNIGNLKLKEGKIANPSLDSTLLLGKATNLTKLDIILNPEKAISEDEVTLFFHYIARRLTHEPISHILGEREFWSLPFYVSQETLDPRSDSETLIEAILEHYKDHAHPLRILDLGTGTGCLLISLLIEYPNALGIGVELSSKALEITQKNIIRHHLENRAFLLQSNWAASIQGSFDIIISNPPYVEEDAELPIEVSQFDPSLALFAGKDGLDAYRLIAPSLKPLLKKNGIAVLELGIYQCESVKEILKKEGFSLCYTRNDLNGIERAIIAVHE